MTEEIQTLINSLRRGQYEDASERIGLLAAALRENGADAATLLPLLRASQVPLRLAALEACRGTTDQLLLDELGKMASDPETRVRAKLADMLGSLSEKSVVNPLNTLATDSDDGVRSAAIKSTTGKAAFVELQKKALLGDSYWHVREQAATALNAHSAPQDVATLFMALCNDRDDDVQRACAEAIERRFTHSSKATEKFLPREIALLTKAERVLKEIGPTRFPQLLEWVASHTTVQVDPAALAQYGTDLTALAKQGTLPRAYGVEQACETIAQLLATEARKSLVLIGPSGVGKTAIVNELVYRLARPENGAWHVLRVSPTDIMAGTRYIGEWETRVRELVAAAQKPRRVLLYIPNLSELSSVGRWSKSDANVAAALAPYIEEGAITILGESTLEEYERGLGGIPALQRLFQRVLVSETSVEQTRALLTAIRDESNAPLPDDVLDTVHDLAAQFLSHIHRPGNAASLLRSILSAKRPAAAAVTTRDVLDTLSKSTGVPVDLLDDTVPLDLEKLRQFFESRIMGQPEAISAVVDLITLIKAGLTDPNKPFGVFLFIGPTGVGKTELARSLAEFIFGDGGRVLRFDMSEYANANSADRLIGGKDENGLLTNAIRQQPFSVVLFDEIEKSHINVFDLCLQIFDAGRLTDGRGRTVNFRRAVIILTSNIGAEAPGITVGFNPAATPILSEPNRERTFRELSRFFRPEFLNRLDRIVHFGPLTLEVAERIARREIELVLRRQGFLRRFLKVEVDPSVVALLVREGYSAHFGARPLKRTVERFCLLPLARSIAGGKVSARGVLFLTARDGKLQVELVRDAGSVKAAAPEPIADPRLSDLVNQIQRRFAAIDAKLTPFAERKSELLHQTRGTDFHHDAHRRTAILDEIHRLEQLLTWASRARSAAAAMAGRIDKMTKVRQSELVREQIDDLDAEARELEFVLTCQNARDLADALLCLTLVDRTGDSHDAVSKLAQMYLAAARRHRMSSEVLAEVYNEKADRVYLEICGLGASALFANESGLHEVDYRRREKSARTGREKEREDRESVRIEVFPLLSELEKSFRSKLQMKAQPLRPPCTRLLQKADVAVYILHEPTLRSFEGWLRGPKDRALEQAARALASQVAAPLIAGRPVVIRRYDLGINTRIKDLRTGRTTNRVEKVLAGQLDSFLFPNQLDSHK